MFPIFNRDLTFNHKVVKNFQEKKDTTSKKIIEEWCPLVNYLFDAEKFNDLWNKIEERKK